MCTHARTRRYKEIVKLRPDIPDVHINLGNINEGLEDFEAAQVP